MNRTSNPTVADGGRAAAFTAGLGVLLVLFGPLGLLAVPLLPLPATLMTARHGFGAGLATSAGGALAVALVTFPLMAGGGDMAGAALTALFSGLMVFLLAGAGAAGGEVLRRGVTEARLVAAMAGFFLVAMTTWGALLLAAMGVSPVEAMRSIADQAVQGTRDSLTGILGADTADSYLRDFQDVMALLPYLLPALLPVLAVVCAVVNVLAGRKVFDRLRQPYPHDMSFRDFRLHYSFLYLVSAGIVCELYAYFAGDAGSVIDLVGMNLLIFSLGLYFIQGLAVAHFFLSHFKVSAPLRVLTYLGLIAMQGFLLMVSWVGLFDAGLDYRRRFKKKNMQSQNH